VNAKLDYDVVIAGGGMVGATLACALGDSNLRVGLVETTPLLRLRPTAPPDARVSAISRASQHILAAVGAWPDIAAWRISPYREMRVWDAAGSGQIHFDSATLGEPLLGWIIENRVMQYALLTRAQTCANVELLCPAALGAIERQDDGLLVQLQDGRTLRTRLLVGADGGNSQVRQWAKIATGGWSYQQNAVVCPVGTERFHAETAWQRFLPTGPLAFLPLHDGRCAIVWSTTPEQAAQLTALDADAFALKLAEAFDWRLGGVTEVGPRATFPLRLQHARHYVAPRIALIGDAAHVIHPLAGQGVNLGLLDAAALADVLLDARGDIGSLKILRRYERWRKGDNLMMLAAMDGFKHLFGSSWTPVRLLRNIGLNVTDATAPVKHLLARRAMGLEGDLPRLARKELQNRV